ncbi:MAG: hypothetical protein II100_00495 [Prevotella sp.]|jgi:hypothetical protein|nr:hypothetical protein [Prevotella sp.]MBQ1667625.1 hypothetical protein [Prevotella sp.]
MKKKLITVLGLMTTLSMLTGTTYAQIQVLQKEKVQGNIVVYEEEDEEEGEEGVEMRSANNEIVEMPQADQQNITIDYLAPLGGELLLLSCLGGAYLLGKRRKE